MKKYLWAIALLMMFLPGTMVLTSCGDDDEDIGVGGSELAEKMAGYWDFFSGTMTFAGQTITIDRNTMMQYKPANVNLWDLTLNITSTTINGEAYTMRGNQIIMSDFGLYEGFTIKVKSVTENVLLLDETISAEGTNITVTMEYHKR